MKSTSSYIKSHILCFTHYRHQFRAIFVAVTSIMLLIMATKSLAALTSFDLTGQARATPQATMGALEIVSAPNTPSGLMIDIQ